MDVKIRFMTFDELDKYQDYVEGLADEGLKQSKIDRLGAAWVMQNIYNIDVKNSNLRARTILQIVNDTVELTFKEEAELEKN